MATLDVSEIIDDPEFSDRISVIRRRQAVGENGRVVDSSEEIPNIDSVIIPFDPSDLDRTDPSMELFNRTIKVITRFRLLDAIAGHFPDSVLWKGTTFVVSKVNYFTHFGEGFCEAVCGSTDRSNNTIEDADTNASDFSNIDNGFLVAICF